MLDTRKVGIKIALLRKKTGYSQDKLAEMLRISPQAISKWENGHSLPDTSLLPVLAQIFGCTIDDMIMPAYSFDEKIEEAKPKQLEEQAEYIARSVMNKLEGKLTDTALGGLDDGTIINAVYKANGTIGHCTVSRGKPFKESGNIVTAVTVRTAQKEYKLIQKIYMKSDSELRGYALLSNYTLKIPQVFYIDFDRQIVLSEDLSARFIRCNNYDEDNEPGVIIRDNYQSILKSAALLHAACWENDEAFDRLGLEWRLQSKEHLLMHISAMAQDFKKYKRNEEAGKIPKVWESFENRLDMKKLDYYELAIEYMKAEYVRLIETRFNTRKNITVIHGDMHPGTAFMARTADREVKFDGFQAVRLGLATEDLAMLLALHIEPEKNKVLPLLDYYYQCLSESVRDYPYETFISDYKLSIAENMFFNIRLINSKIFDFKMRDKAIKAFESFVTERK